MTLPSPRFTRPPSTVSPTGSSTFHAGQRRPVEFLVTAMATEQLIHGWDIATAAGRGWRPEEALTATLSAFFLTMALLLYRGERAALRFGDFWFTPSGGAGWGFRLDGNGIVPLPRGDSARCHVGGNGFDLMLWTSRRLPWSASSLTASGSRAGPAVDLMASFDSA